MTSDELRNSLKVPSLDHTFANFKMAPGVKTVYEVIREFSEKLTPALILCHGGIGNGKTYLLGATAIRLRERGVFSSVQVWPIFTGWLKDAMGKDGSLYDRILMSRCHVPILLMDDYGMGTKGTDWERAILEQLIDFRYRDRLPTILTTNIPLDDLPERVVSRFSDPDVGVIVENKGGDYRRKAKEV